MEENKLLFGKLLGELYRIEKKVGMPCPATEAQIYGLVNGFENVIEEELESLGYISNEKLTTVINVLTPYWEDPQKLASFKGFYDIEHQLSQRGIDRGEAKRILKYLYANGQFIEVIEKMDSSDSPCECRTFNLRDWDK